MIGYIEGEVHAVRDGYCIVVVGGIGYKVFATKETLARAPHAFWTYLSVRENALDLYGFETEQELRFFELLLTVSGIGPKSALNILDIAHVEALRTAIVGSNASYLTNVSGIGKKTADKIVLELKDKVGLAAESASIAVAEDSNTIEALKSLGFSVAEAREALRKVPHTITDGNARLREALRGMSKP